MLSFVPPANANSSIRPCCLYAMYCQYAGETKIQTVAYHYDQYRDNSHQLYSCSCRPHFAYTHTHTHTRYDFCCSKYLIGVNVSGLKFEFLVFNLFLCSASVDGSCLVSVTDGCVDSIVG